MNNIFKNLTLADFALAEDYQEKPITYSGIQGKAEVMGCYIIVFRTNSKPHTTVALSLDDMLEDGFIEEVGNDILKCLNLPIKLRDSAETIKKVYGIPYSSNYITEDMAQYYYLTDNEKTLVTFDINEVYGLCSLEITNDKEIVEKKKQRLYSFV